MANVQSLTANLNKIKILIEELHPAMLFLTETRTTDMIYDAELHVHNYSLQRANSPSRHSGGVAIYAYQNIQIQTVHQANDGYDTILICDITSQDFRGRYFLIYHSPNSSHVSFLHFFGRYIE